MPISTAHRHNPAVMSSFQTHSHSTVDLSKLQQVTAPVCGRPEQLQAYPLWPAIRDNNSIAPPQVRTARTTAAATRVNDIGMRCLGSTQRLIPHTSASKGRPIQSTVTRDKGSISTAHRTLRTLPSTLRKVCLTSVEIPERRGSDKTASVLLQSELDKAS